MAFTKTWNEDAPAGGDNPRSGDNEIRDFKYAIRERLANDHYFLASEGGVTTIGYHKKSTYMVQGSNPTAVADTIIGFGKDVSSVCELHTIDENSKVTQLTSGGNVAGQVPSNAVLLFVGTSCPTGYTDITSTYDDKYLKATVLASAAVETGGSATLDISHTHSGGSLSAASPASAGTQRGGDPIEAAHINHSHTISGSTASGGSSSLANTPAYAGFLLCQKD